MNVIHNMRLLQQVSKLLSFIVDKSLLLQRTSSRACDQRGQATRRVHIQFIFVVCNEFDNY